VVESKDTNVSEYKVEDKRDNEIKLMIPRGAGYVFLEALDTPLNSEDWGEEQREATDNGRRGFLTRQEAEKFANGRPFILFGGGAVTFPRRGIDEGSVELYYTEPSQPAIGALADLPIGHAPGGQVDYEYYGPPAVATPQSRFSGNRSMYDQFAGVGTSGYTGYSQGSYQQYGRQASSSDQTGHTQGEFQQPGEQASSPAPNLAEYNSDIEVFEPWDDHDRIYEADD
jgi:hypothetical protein